MTTQPRRVQLRRTRGWKKPDGAISAARPHKWGNPFKVGVHAVDAAEAVQLYRRWLPGTPLLSQISGASQPMTTATARLNAALLTLAAQKGEHGENYQ
jgi:hypothetical protein